jgi:hypothetical protein
VSATEFRLCGLSQAEPNFHAILLVTNEKHQRCSEWQLLQQKKMQSVSHVMIDFLGTVNILIGSSHLQGWEMAHFAKPDGCRSCCHCHVNV